MPAPKQLFLFAPTEHLKAETRLMEKTRKKEQWLGKKGLAKRKRKKKKK